MTGLLACLQSTSLSSPRNKSMRVSSGLHRSPQSAVTNVLCVKSATVFLKTDDQTRISKTTDDTEVHNCYFALLCSFKVLPTFSSEGKPPKNPQNCVFCRLARKEGSFWSWISFKVVLCACYARERAEQMKCECE